MLMNLFISALLAFLFLNTCVIYSDSNRGFIGYVSPIVFSCAVIVVAASAFYNTDTLFGIKKYAVAAIVTVGTIIWLLFSFSALFPVLRHKKDEDEEVGSLDALLEESLAQSEQLTKPNNVKRFHVHEMHDSLGRLVLDLDGDKPCIEEKEQAMQASISGLIGHVRGESEGSKADSAFSVLSAMTDFWDAADDIGSDTRHEKNNGDDLEPATLFQKVMSVFGCIVLVPAAVIAWV